MKTERVSFFSDGMRLSGLLRLPDTSAEHLPFIVQGPGWLGLADAKLYLPYHEAFTSAGFSVLIFDYRGFGQSEGDRTIVSPRQQVEDWRNALCYMRSRPDMDRRRAALFGSGGTGGGNAVLVAALEPEIRATISQVPVADGSDWMHRMRTEHEWTEFLSAVDADRCRRALTGTGELVDPRQRIAVEGPERRAAGIKADVDSRITKAVALSSGMAILDYRPIDAVPCVRGLMVIGVEDDAVTPTDHAVRLYEAARQPKRLVLQRHTTHYAAYKRYGPAVVPMMIEWLERLVVDCSLEVRDRSGDREDVRCIVTGDEARG